MKEKAFKIIAVLFWMACCFTFLFGGTVGLVGLIQGIAVTRYLGGIGLLACACGFFQCLRQLKELRQA